MFSLPFFPRKENYANFCVIIILFLNFDLIYFCSETILFHVLTYVKIIWYCMYMRIFNLQMPFFPKCTTLYFNQQYKNASIDSHPFDHWVLPEFLYLYSFQLGIYPGMDLLVMDSCIFNRNYQTISKAMI